MIGAAHSLQGGPSLRTVGSISKLLADWCNLDFRQLNCMLCTEPLELASELFTGRQEGNCCSSTPTHFGSTCTSLPVITMAA